MNKPLIKTLRQNRALKALLHGPIAIKDIGQMIGALNPRQVIFELRQQGFNEIILTRRFTTIDQDGKACRPGEYYIPERYKSDVASALENTFQANKKRSNVSPLFNDNNREGV